jgi:hypothetical protein
MSVELVWDRPPELPVATLQAKHLMVQAPVNELARCRRDQIRIADQETPMRARLAVLRRMSRWKRFWRGLNGERKQLTMNLAALRAESAALTYKIDLNVRTVEWMLGSGDDYVSQLKRAISRDS